MGALLERKGWETTIWMQLLTIFSYFGFLVLGVLIYYVYLFIATGAVDEESTLSVYLAAYLSAIIGMGVLFGVVSMFSDKSKIDSSVVELGSGRSGSWFSIRNILVGGVVCMIAGGVIILGLLIGLGAGMEAGYFPDTIAQPKGQIHTRYIDSLKQSDIISEDEEVLYFYSAGFFSILADGNLFTDKRVISYETLEGELSLQEVEYMNIEAIEFTGSDNWIDDSVITITQENGDSFILYVSTEGGLDKDFYEKLNQIWGQTIEP